MTTPDPFTAAELDEIESVVRSCQLTLANDDFPDDDDHPNEYLVRLIAQARRAIEHHVEEERLKARVAEIERKLTERTYQLENVLDASREGMWMARALDAERENKANLFRIAELETQLSEFRSSSYASLQLKLKAAQEASQDNARRVKELETQLAERRTPELAVLEEHFKDMVGEAEDELEFEGRMRLFGDIVTAARAPAEAKLAEREGLERRRAECSGWRYEICKRCGRRNCVGFTVSDATWADVSRDRWNVLCLACFDEEAQAFGIAYEVTETHLVSWVDSYESAALDEAENASGK